MEEESAERSELRRMQREEERERRRIRDRRRRQSMTLEQRERHLARRRRNYQLRRLRAETTRRDSSTKISHESGGEIVIANRRHDQALNSAPQVISSQKNDHDFEKLSSECLQSVGSETLAPKTVNMTRRLRLSHLRCLARSLNGGGIHEKEAAKPVSKRNVDDTTLQFGDNNSSRLPSGLRLNRLKGLARGLSTVNNKIRGQSHQVEQNVVVGSGELHKLGQTDHC